MTTTLKIVLAVSYLLSGLMVYSRTYGISSPVRLFLPLIAVVGLVVFLLNGYLVSENPLLYGLLSGPIVVGLLLGLLNSISKRIKGREFYLHAHGSKDMVGLGLPRYNKHYRWTDKLFSLILIMMWIGWPLIFVVIVNSLE